MSKVIELEKKEDFDQYVKEGVALVDFFAIWCGPCQAMKPVFDSVSIQENEVKFISIDVDKFADIAAKYQVMSIPTFVIIKDGELVSQKSGAMSEDELKAWIEKNK